MPSNYNQMGGVPDFYGAILNDARQSLVKMPDGTYAQAPQRPQPMSVDDIYRGMYPSAPTAPNVSRVTPEGLNVYSRPAVQIDANGQPMVGNSTGSGFTTPTMASYRAAEEEGGYLPYTPRPQSGARPAVTIGTQPAGTVPMPPGVRPGSVDRAYAQMGVSPGLSGKQMGYNARTGAYEVMVPGEPYTAGPSRDSRLGPVGTVVAGKDTSQLNSPLLAFNPDGGNPALTAIDQLTGSGQSTLFPRPMPMAFAPRGGGMPPAPIPLRSSGAPSVPQAPAAITFKRGDTVSKLAKARGMTVSSFADLYGISDPNRIVAGKTVVPRAPTMPFTPTNAARLSPVYSARDRQLAEGRNSQIDEFGNIR